MFNKVRLTKEQKKVLKTAIKYNLRTLKQILENDIEEDLTMYCIEHEVPRDKLNESIEDNIELFEELLDNPQGVFSLDEDNMVVIKTILENCVNHIKYEKPKAQIWAKLFVAEKLSIYTNLN